MSGFLPDRGHTAARMNRGAGPYVQACENKESPIYRGAFLAEGQGCLASKERSAGREPPHLQAGDTSMPQAKDGFGVDSVAPSQTSPAISVGRRILDLAEGRINLAELAADTLDR